MNDIHHFYRCLLRAKESEIILGFRAKPQKNGIYRLEWANTKANRLIRHPPWARSTFYFYSSLNNRRNWHILLHIKTQYGLVFQYNLLLSQQCAETTNDRKCVGTCNNHNPPHMLSEDRMSLLERDCGNCIILCCYIHPSYVNPPEKRFGFYTKSLQLSAAF